MLLELEIHTFLLIQLQHLAAEMNCDVIFKGTSVDGVYESDPKLNPNSKKYSTISYKKILDDNLKVMDICNNIS